MIKKHIAELKETWDLTTEELKDIEERMEELAHYVYNMDREPKPDKPCFTAYGKKEDYE